MKNGVHIIECLDQKDPGSEGKCLRHVFKLMEIETKYTHAKSIDVLLSAIEGSRYKFIHISTHGAVGKEDQFKGWWTPSGIGTKRHVFKLNGKLKNTAIISTACKSGAKGFGRHVVDIMGCKYFIGPSGSPKFYNSTLFAHIFYHKLFKTKGGVAAAFKSYDENYKNPHGFKLYVQSKP